MENVKGLTNKGFKDLFEDMLNELDLAGYNNYWQVLNAKDYGIPQNRERVFIISIRKDIDDGKFEFPEPFDSGLRLKDLLEDSVDDKYYVDKSRTVNLIEELSKEHFPVVCAERGRYNSEGNIEQKLELRKDKNTNTLTTVQKDNLIIEPCIPNEIQMIEVDQLVRIRKHDVDTKALVDCLRCFKSKSELTNRQISDRLSRPITMVEHWFRRDSSFSIPDEDIWFELKMLLGIDTDEFDLAITEFIEKEGVYEKGNRYYHEKGISPTLTTSPSERIIKESPNELDFVGGIGNKDWAGDGKTLSRNYPQGNRIYDAGGIACSQTSQGGGVGSYTGLYLEDGEQEQNRVIYKVRKLTPLESFRLMGFDDEDFYKARQSLMDTYYNGNDRANSQLYKQAGNSIAICVLVEIYKNLFKEYIDK